MYSGDDVVFVVVVVDVVVVAAETNRSHVMSRLGKSAWLGRCCFCGGICRTDVPCRFGVVMYALPLDASK
jgi:hypothetical protein